MRTLLPVLLFLMILPTGLRAQPGDRNVVAGEDGQRCDMYLNRLAGMGFSGAVIVARGGRILVQKGYGLADRETGRPVTPATVFSVGSLTKQFTGAAILTLEMMGELQTGDLLADHIDGVPPDKQEITLHHLLTHTAGFPGAIGDDFDTGADTATFLAAALETELLFEPGQRYEYSNVGFSLLGIVIEKVTELGYEEFLQRHLFEPAGMHRTGYLLPDYRDDELAIGYRGNERWGSVIRRPMLPDGPGWHLRANGGVHSTVRDMLRWQQALAGEELLSRQAKEKYFHPWADEGGGDSFYGYGWVIVPDYRGRTLITHNGGNVIFSADFRWFPDEDIVICAMSSLSEFAPVDYVTRDLTRLLLGADVRLPPVLIEPAPGWLEACAGVYRLPEGGLIEVQQEGAGLVLRGSGSRVASLLIGGSGRAELRLAALKEHSARILRRAYGGDFTGIQEAFGGGMSLEQVAAEEGRWMRMREERYGAFRDLEAVRALGEGGRVSVWVRIEYERGTGYIRYIWDGDELAGVELVSSAPVPEVRVFPVSETGFVSYSLHSPVSVRVEFEVLSGGQTPVAVIFQSAEEEVRALRRPGASRDP